MLKPLIAGLEGPEALRVVREFMVEGDVAARSSAGSHSV
jgi:hypothetical protein